MTAQPAPGSDGRDQAHAGVPWAGGRALLDVVGIYIVALLIGQLAAVVIVAVRGTTDDLPLVVLVAVSPVALLVSALAWLRLRYGDRARLVRGRARWRLSDLAIGLGLGVACFLGQRLIVIAAVAIASWFGAELPPVQETFRMIAGNPRTAPVLAVTAVLLAPLSEEVLFRGVLFQGLRQRQGFWAAALASAAVFTLAHLGDGSGVLGGVVIAAGILPLGVAFAAILERRGSVLACAATHSAYNAAGVALLIATSSAV